jgi:hypothetical protein
LIFHKIVATRDPPVPPTAKGFLWVDISLTTRRGTKNISKRIPWSTQEKHGIKKVQVVTYQPNTSDDDLAIRSSSLMN